MLRSVTATTGSSRFELVPDPGDRHRARHVVGRRTPSGGARTSPPCRRSRRRGDVGERRRCLRERERLSERQAGERDHPRRRVGDDVQCDGTEQHEDPGAVERRDDVPDVAVVRDPRQDDRERDDDDGDPERPEDEVPRPPAHRATLLSRGTRTHRAARKAAAPAAVAPRRTRARRSRAADQPLLLPSPTARTSPSRRSLLELVPGRPRARQARRARRRFAGPARAPPATRRESTPSRPRPRAARPRAARRLPQRRGQAAAHTGRRRGSARRPAERDVGGHERDGDDHGGHDRRRFSQAHVLTREDDGDERRDREERREQEGAGRRQP